MKKIRLIFLFLGIFLLLSASNAEILGDNCSPSDHSYSFTSSETNSTYEGNVTTGSSETFYFQIKTAGTLVLTPDSGGNKANIAYSENSCPVSATSYSPITITVIEPTDINVLIQGTNDAIYTLTAEFTPLPVGLLKTNFPAQVQEGMDTNVTYTLTAINYSDEDPNITITDTLPSEVNASSVTFTALGGFTCETNTTSRTVTCTGVLNAHEDPIDIIFKAIVHPASTGDIINTATMEAIMADGIKTATGSSTLQAVDGAAAVDLEIQKFASGIKVEGEDYTIVPPDTNFTYVIFVINHAQGKYADLVTVTDIFPDDSNVTFISYGRGSGWDCDVDHMIGEKTGTFECYFDRPMGHEITYFTITAHTDDVDVNVTAINKATVKALNDDIGNHDTEDTAEILISDINLSTGGGMIGGQYLEGGAVEVSDIAISTRAGARLQTKVASTTDETIGTYIINSTGNVDLYQNVTTLYGNNKLVPLTVILKLGTADCYLLDEPHLSYDESKVSAVFEGGDNYTPAAADPLNGDVDFDLRNIATRDARIIMQYIDINAKLNEGNETCRVSSVDGNIKGLPQCLTNAASSNKFDNNKYINTFGIEAFVRCAIQNGQPCSSETGGYGDDPYDSEYGCYECTLGGAGSCSKDHFAIRPEEFDVNILDQVLPLRAGKEYDLSFKGRTARANETTLDYNETQDSTFYVDAIVINNTYCDETNLTISPSVHFRDGLHDGNFSFNDIGDINFTIHETNGTEFAIVDADDTPLLEDRLIKEKNIIFTVIPHHFNIEANLTNHKDTANFTYLHDINKYDSDDNHSMGALLEMLVTAEAENNSTTKNYTEYCYAKDTNLSLDIIDTNISYPGSTQALQLFLYYNLIEDKERNSSLQTPDTSNAPMESTILLDTLDINHTTTEASFPTDAADGNGTARIKYKLNFDRKQDLVVNPFKMSLQNVTIKDEDNVTEGTVTLTDKDAIMYYARTRASKFFYEDITDLSVLTPIAIDIYCNQGFTKCSDAYGIDTVNGQINEANWWLSVGHDMDREDGNITIKIGAITNGSGAPKLQKATAESDTLDVNITSQGKDDDVSVVGHTTSRPMTVEIELVTDDTLTSYTNTWLIYNPDDAILTPSPFYKVEFINESGWTGVGQTGNVIDNNASSTKTKRLNW